MTDTWYVWYDAVPREDGIGIEDGCELFSHPVHARRRYEEIRTRLLKEAQYLSGKEEPAYPVFHEYEGKVTGVIFASHLALTIGKAVWK
ncbi:MAG: hypothetical protein HMLIMOIP_002699 [Candidatus Nitrosomirales archaeon]|jgi:hypothetical protein